MMALAPGIKDPFNVTVQCPHDADPGQRRRATALRNEDQRFHSGLPFRRGVFGLRQLRDVGGGIPQGKELATIRKRDWIVERSRPEQLKSFFKNGRGRVGGEAAPNRAVRRQGLLGHLREL